MAERSDKEHRDFYIAMIVGGLGLILILLWLFSPQTAVAGTPAGDTTNNILTATPDPNANDYNYNIPGFDPGPPITIAQPGYPPSGNSGNCGCSGSNYNVACGGAGTVNGVNAAQFQTLIGP